MVPPRPLAASPPGRLAMHNRLRPRACVIFPRMYPRDPVFGAGRCGRTAALGSLPMVAALDDGAASGTDAMLFYSRFHSCFDSLVPIDHSVRAIYKFFSLSAIMIHSSEAREWPRLLPWRYVSCHIVT